MRRTAGAKPRGHTRGCLFAGMLLAVAVLFAAEDVAQAVTLVVPNALAGTEGNSNNATTNSPRRSGVPQCLKGSQPPKNVEQRNRRAVRLAKELDYRASPVHAVPGHGD